MDEAFKLVLSQAAGGSFSIILLVAAIAWLNAQNRKSETAREKERVERWGELKERIGALESAMKICDEDRRQMRAEIVSLARKSPPA